MGYHSQIIICHRIYNYLPQNSRPPLKVKGGDLIGRASPELVQSNEEFRHGIVSQYHCKCGLGGPGIRCGTSSTYALPTRTKSTSQGLRYFSILVRYPCRCKYRNYFTNSYVDSAFKYPRLHFLLQDPSPTLYTPSGSHFTLKRYSSQYTLSVGNNLVKFHSIVDLKVIKHSAS